MILELQLEGNCHSLGLKTFKRKKRICLTTEADSCCF